MYYPKKFMFMLNETIHEQLKELAENEQRSMGSIVRLLIQKAYEQMVADESKLRLTS